MPGQLSCLIFFFWEKEERPAPAATCAVFSPRPCPVLVVSQLVCQVYLHAQALYTHGTKATFLPTRTCRRNISRLDSEPSQAWDRVPGKPCPLFSSASKEVETRRGVSVEPKLLYFIHLLSCSPIFKASFALESNHVNYGKSQQPVRVTSEIRTQP